MAKRPHSTAITTPILRRAGRLGLPLRQARETEDVMEADDGYARRLPGHMTASAFILSKDRTRMLLLHHRKLDLWLQPGGHADGDHDLGAVARREAEEETGLHDIVPIGDGAFDIDVHHVPASNNEPAHNDHDVGYLFEGDPDEPLALAVAESIDGRWFNLDEDVFAQDRRLLRAVRLLMRAKNPT